MNYIIIRSVKSRGIAALLVFLFGPLGMFYSTITGALIMSFGVAPFIIWAVFKSSGLALILLPFYFISCLIWAIQAVNFYNKKITKEAYNNNKKMSKELIDSNSKSNYTQGERNELINDIKGLNVLYDTNVIDIHKYEKQKEILERKMYNLENGVVSEQSYQIQEVSQNKKSNLLPILLVLIPILLFGYFLYDKETNSLKFEKISSIFSSQKSKEKEEIKKQLEKTYFDVFNGKYTAQNFTGGVETPFYNTNISTLVVMGLGPLATFTGNLKVEPSNIDVYELNENGNTARLKYDVEIITKEDTVLGKIDMEAKKIGGMWKFNAEKFFGNLENSRSANEIKTNNKQTNLIRRVEAPLFQITGKTFYDIYNGSTKYKRIKDVDEINNLLTPELKNQLIQDSNSKSLLDDYEFFDLGEVRYKEFNLHFFVYNYIGGMGDYQTAQINISDVSGSIIESKKIGVDWVDLEVDDRYTSITCIVSNKGEIVMRDESKDFGKKTTNKTEKYFINEFGKIMKKL